LFSEALNGVGAGIDETSVDGFRGRVSSGLGGHQIQTFFIENVLTDFAL
jgi:hypothetical protein